MHLDPLTVIIVIVICALGFIGGVMFRNTFSVPFICEAAKVAEIALSFAAGLALGIVIVLFGIFKLLG